MIIRTDKELFNFYEKAKEEPLICWDTETQGLLIYPKRNIETGEWEEHWIILHSVLLPSDESTYSLPVRMESADNLSNDAVLHVFSELFKNPELELLCHNGKFDIKFIEKEGVEFKGKLIDSMLMAHLWNENEESFKLKELGVKYFGLDANEEQLALKEAAYNYLSSELNGLMSERIHLETDLKLMEQNWKRELKSEYKDDLRNLRTLYNRFVKLEEKGVDLDESLEPLAEAVESLRGKMFDITRMRAKDNVEQLPGWLDKFDRRNNVMARVDRLKRTDPMSILAKLDIDIVSKYAEQDVLITWNLYNLIRYGRK